MVRTPRILPGYSWDIDRTGDIVAVRVLRRGVVVHYVCLGVTRTITLRLRLVFLAALWSEFVVSPAFTFINRWKDKREARDEARALANLTYAAALNGRWDWRGQRLPQTHP